MKTNRFPFYYILIFSIIFFSGCSKSSNDENINSIDEEILITGGVDLNYYKQIVNTSWKLNNVEQHLKSHKVEYFDYQNVDWKETYTLKSNMTYNTIDSYLAMEMLVDYPESHIFYDQGYSTSEDWTVHNGILLSCFNFWGEIIKINKNQLILKKSFPKNNYVDYELQTYIKVLEPSHKKRAESTGYLQRTSDYVKEGNGTSAGNNNDNSNEDSSYSLPDISYDDSTPYTTKLKIVYRIWNKDECGSLSNAKIFYGTSSPSKSVSATISGQYITATISGLKKGTDYYVKCSVKGQAGTSTSETTRLCTLN